MTVKIISDSTCDLSPELLRQYDVSITPLSVCCGERVGADGTEITPDDIYEYVHAEGKLPQTSAVNVADYWDKLLHLCGGVVFALLGSYLPVVINRKYENDRLLRVLFALMFSISVSALWEFYEFGMDRWFGMDMQRDTIIHAIHSYDLGEATGVIGSIDQIDSVIVNGEPLEGYIDIGLIDTMGDMMIETAGAAAYAVVFALDKGRHPAFIHAAMASLPGKKSVHAQVE